MPQLVWVKPKKIIPIQGDDYVSHLKLLKVSLNLGQHYRRGEAEVRAGMATWSVFVANLSDWFLVSFS